MLPLITRHHLSSTPIWCSVNTSSILFRRSSGTATLVNSERKSTWPIFDLRSHFSGSWMSEPYWTGATNKILQPLRPGLASSTKRIPYRSAKLTNYEGNGCLGYEKRLLSVYFTTLLTASMCQRSLIASRLMANRGQLYVKIVMLFDIKGFHAFG